MRESEKGEEKNRKKKETNTQHYQPFGILGTIRVRLGISEGFPFGIFGVFYFLWGSMADENGFPAPFDYDLVRTLCERVIMQAGRGEGWRVGRSSRFCPAG